MIIIYCNILDDKFPHVLYEYSKLNHLNMIQSINNRLVRPSEYTWSNLFMYAYALVMYLFMIKIYSIFNQLHKILIYLYAILSLIILVLILQYKNNLYIQDDKNRDAIYYSSLVSLYDLISKMDIHDVRSNHIKISNIYNSIPNILYDYITKQISINKNNIILNICTIIFSVYILLLIYDIIIVITYLSSASAFQKYTSIQNYGIKFKNSNDIKTFDKIYDNNKNQNIWKELDMELYELYITKEMCENYYKNIQTNNVIYISNDKTPKNKYLFETTFIAPTNDSTYQYVITFKKQTSLKDYLSKIHTYDHYKISHFVPLHRKIKQYIHCICDDYNDKPPQEPSNFGKAIQSISILKLYDLDRTYVTIFIVLLCIYIMLNIYFIKKYKLESINNSIISFNNITQELSKNYSNYILYSLQNTYYQKQQHILDNIIVTEGHKIYFKYFLYLNIILIILFIILLILNRYVAIYNIIYSAYSVIHKMIMSIEDMHIASEISILVLVMLFIIFLCSLKLYVIILLNNIMNNYMNIINNIDNAQYINNACLTIYNIANNSLLSQNNDKYNVQGIVNIKYQYNNKVNTINIIPNKLNMISYHSAINIEDVIINPIKSRSNLISVKTKNNTIINLSQISSRNLYNMFMYSDDNPRILHKTFEDNLWLGIPRKYLTPSIIKNLYDIIPLDKVSETCSAYSCFDNPNAVQYASGGEKQRIAMARIIGRYLVQSNINPNKQFMICFNDSFAGVDFNTARFIISKLKMLLRNNNITIIIITNQKEYYMYADNHIYISSDYSLKEAHYH